MKLITKQQQESYENARICHIRKEKLENRYFKDTKYPKVRDHCHYAGEYRGCNLKYSLPKKMPMVFHNGCRYEYHFIMKKLKLLVYEKIQKNT